MLNQLVPSNQFNQSKHFMQPNQCTLSALRARRASWWCLRRRHIRLIRAIELIRLIELIGRICVREYTQIQKFQNIQKLQNMNYGTYINNKIKNLKF